ncbi:MAG: GYF domain-containing protein [Muribaculaceae bacterium]|nr:GYF domain-containing protein [Muribaculaceae bacterium]
MEQYYMVIGGRRIGPLPLSELSANGLQGDTLVWRPGMQTWEPARTLPELASQLMPEVEESAFGTYAEPVVPPPAYKNPPRTPYGNPYTPTHYNWMTWAIVGTVFGFLFSCIGVIFGIIAINKAGMANRMFAEGYEVEGIHANATAKTMTIISLVLAGIGLLINISLFVTGGLMSLFS